jgi:antitoxin MazE6
MRTVISLPSSLRVAIGEYLRTHRREGVTEALNRIYGEEPSSLEPVITALQSASLPREEW